MKGKREGAALRPCGPNPNGQRLRELFYVTDNQTKGLASHRPPPNALENYPHFARGSDISFHLVHFFSSPVGGLIRLIRVIWVIG